MWFRCAALSLLVVAAAAAPVEDFTADIPATSSLGNKLLSKARQLGDDDAADDFVWAVDYSLKFNKCHTEVSFMAEGNGDEEDGVPYQTQRLVEFKLCPSNSCSYGTSGCATYIVEMAEFVAAYVEYKAELQEQICEAAQDACENYQCANANDDDVCMASCLEGKGLSECIENEDEEDEFDVADYLECAEMEAQDNDNNNNGNYNYNDDNYKKYSQYAYQLQNGYIQLFMAPTCSSNGNGINLAVFYDEGCSDQASTGTYSNYNYGAQLPYEKSSLVENDCISCLAVDEDADDDGAEPEAIEMCENMYEVAGKCEENLSFLMYPSSGACDYIQNILPSLDKSISSTSSSKRSGGGSKGWTIFFGLTTVALAAYAFALYSKLQRKGVDLSAGDGAMA